jgi:deoxyadenosine/deoxycytidine kinase
MDSPRYIAVEGPIGVGKTALARILAERLRARLVESPENPFLADFYRDPRHHAFQAQLYSLLARYQQQGSLRQQDLFAGGVVTDYLFQRDRLFAQLTLSPSELSLYDKVYRLLDGEVLRPDLVVYLQARPDVLLERARRRSGEGARNLPGTYVAEVARSYAEFFFQHSETPLLVVNTSEIDFVESPADQDELVAVIRRTRGGVSHYNPLGSR